MRIALLIPLAVIQLVIVRMLAGHYAHRIASNYPSQHGKPDGFDWFVSLILGFLWLVVIPVWCAWRSLSWLMVRIPRIGAEAEHLAEVRAREHRERLDEVEMAP